MCPNLLQIEALDMLNKHYVEIKHNKKAFQSFFLSLLNIQNKVIPVLTSISISFVLEIIPSF